MPPPLLAFQAIVRRLAGVGVRGLAANFGFIGREPVDEASHVGLQTPVVGAQALVVGLDVREALLQLREAALKLGKPRILLSSVHAVSLARVDRFSCASL